MAIIFVSSCPDSPRRRFPFPSPFYSQVPPFDASQLKASECSLQERYDLCRSVADECIQVCDHSTNA